MKTFKGYIHLVVFALSFLTVKEASSQGFQSVVGVKISDFSNLGPDLTITLNNRGGKRDPFNVNPDEYRTMGIYRVKGNSKLLRGANVTDVFMNVGYARNVNVVWDTYDQKFGVLVDNETKLLQLAFNDVDSFFVNKDSLEGISQPAMFINASKLDKNKKFFAQRMVNGNRFELYKSYRSEMKPSSNDIAQTNLQEFVLMTEYYYLDKNTKSFKKIKANSTFLKEEFKANKEAEAYFATNSFDNENKDKSLVAFFSSLK